MTANLIILLVAFGTTSSLVLVISWLISDRDENRLDFRLAGLAEKGLATQRPVSVAHLAKWALPKMGKSLLPDSDQQRTRLQTRLLRAGFYGRQALVLYLGVKILLMLTPWLLGLAAGLGGLVPIHLGVTVGALVGLAGMVGPGLWLDGRKARRQMALRAALTDVLDVLVICLEGGASLAEGFRRVVEELGTAHPLLRAELQIVQREAQLGRSMGEALRHFADRSDLEELRILASTVSQVQRLGGGLVATLRAHAEAMRFRQAQFAEEMAQKAATKILFPVMLFIFPGIFVIVLGPALIPAMELVAEMNKPQGAPQQLESPRQR